MAIHMLTPVQCLRICLSIFLQMYRIPTYGSTSIHKQSSGILLIQRYPPPQQTQIDRQTSLREQVSEDIICDIASTRANERGSMKQLILAASCSSMWRSTCAPGSAPLPHDHVQPAAVAFVSVFLQHSLAMGLICVVVI